MADLGDTSMAGTHNKHKRMSWVTVGLIVVASVVLGLAFVLQSVPLAAVGVVLGLAGMFTGWRGKIFEDAY